jgi:hypothetical protein
MTGKKPFHEGKQGRPKGVEILGAKGATPIRPTPEVHSGSDRREEVEILDSRSVVESETTEGVTIMDKVTGEEFDGRRNRERHEDLDAEITKRSGPGRQVTEDGD